MIDKLKAKARRHEKAEEWQEALAAYRRVVRAAESRDVDVDPGIYNRIGDMLFRLGRTHEAAESYRSAADRYAEIGLLNNAIALCNKVLRQIPNEKEVLLNIGRLSASQGFFTDARRAFLKYAEVKSNVGDMHAAFKALAEFADLADDPEVREMLAARLIDHGDADEAVEQLVGAWKLWHAAGNAAAADAVRDRIREIAPESVPPAEPPEPDGDDETGPAAGVGADPVSSAPAGLPGFGDALGSDSRGAPPDPASSGDASADDATPHDAAPDASAGRTDDGTDDDIIFESAADAAGFGADEPAPRSNDAGPASAEGARGAPPVDDGDEGSVEPLPLLDPYGTDTDEPDGGTPAAESDAPDVAEPPAPDPHDPEAESEPEADSAETLPLLDLDDFGTRDAPEEPGFAGETDAVDEAHEADGAEDAGEPRGGAELDGIDGFGEIPDIGDIDEIGPDGETGADRVLGSAELDLDSLDAASTADATADADPESSPEPDAKPEARRSPAEDAIAQARRLTERGRREAALELLDDAHRVLADAGRLDDALRVADECIAMDVSRIAPYQARLEYAVRLGDVTRQTRACLGLADALRRAGAERKAQEVYRRVLDLDPENAAAREALAQPGAEPGPDRGAQDGDGRGPAPSGGDSFVDLGSLLDADEPAPERTTRFVVPHTPPSGDEDRDFAEMLATFRTKVAENVDDEDIASHYDLGLAFKEMGLIDEAIEQFQTAVRGGDATNQLRVYEELGECFLQREQHNVALQVLQRALRLSRADDDEGLLGIFYHLGRCYEALGRPDDAREAYERVVGLDVTFRDVSDRMAQL